MDEDKAGTLPEPFVPRDPGGRFMEGHQVNRGRKRFTSDFVSDLLRDWQVHGRTVLAKVRQSKPDLYLRIVVAALPKVSVQVADTEGLSDEALHARLSLLARSYGRRALADLVEQAEDGTRRDADGDDPAP